MKAFLALPAVVLVTAWLPALVQAQPAAAAPRLHDAPSPYVVVVAPGHGGEDPGAIFPPDSDDPLLAEKDITLAVGLKLRDRLSGEAVKVVMTRTSDLTTTAEDRAAL